MYIYFSRIPFYEKQVELRKKLQNYRPLSSWEKNVSPEDPSHLSSCLLLMRKTAMSTNTTTTTAREAPPAMDAVSSNTLSRDGR